MAGKDALGTLGASYQCLVNRYLTDVATSSGAPDNVYSVTAQYSPGLKSTFGGSLVDTSAWPADSVHGNPYGGCVPGPPLRAGDPPYSWCITDAQIQTELSAVLAAHPEMSSPGAAYPTPTYFVMLPAGVDVCAGADLAPTGANQCAHRDLCAYHSNFTNAAGGAVGPLYAVIPWANVSGCNQGARSPNGDLAADVGIDLISHEHNEIISDPYASGWYADGAAPDENGDKCVQTFGAGPSPGDTYNQVFANNFMAGNYADRYWLQDEFSNNAPGGPGCQPRPGSEVNTQVVPPASGLSVLAPHTGTVLGAHTTYTIFWNGHPGAPPTATIASAPPTGHVGQALSFQAAGGADPQGLPLTYSWTFGDGSTAAGPSAVHSYLSSGPQTVQLTVSDADGYSTTTAQTVVIFAPPAASFSAPTGPILARTPATFDASASGDPGGTITSWSWRFGDGTTATGVRVRHAFSSPGYYYVTLTLTDSNGSSASESKVISVVARAGPHLRSAGPASAVLRHGKIVLRTGQTLDCPATSGSCSVTVTVTSDVRQARRARAGQGSRFVTHTVTIGVLHQSLGPGGHAALSVLLNRAGVAVLRSARRLRATLYISLFGPDSSGRAPAITVTVRPPPRPSASARQRVRRR